MKRRKILALGLVVALIFSLAGCGSSKEASTKATQKAKKEGEATKEAAQETEGTEDGFQEIVLGETGKDITTTIKWLTHKTDLVESGRVKEYIEVFNKTYPNITVEVEGITNYADDSLLRLTAGDWGDIMMIPAVDKAELPNYFVSYGGVDQLGTEYDYIANWMYEDKVYGMPSSANAQGILYNKKVFEEAGIKSIPKMPEEFIAALQAIKNKTDAIPLYTNYAAKWTMGAWDAYIGASANGNGDFTNLVLPYQSNPFSDRGDGTGPYALYKVLYDVANLGLIEEDYTTTDWEGCKAMINRGEIATMVLGSWAVPQMQAAGDNADDIGYMSFPISVNGKQYASAGPDYCYGINVKASDDNKLASEIFVKYMVEQSGYSFNEGGLPILKSDSNFPETYTQFEGIDYIVDAPAKPGNEDILNKINAESELMINEGGDIKLMEIIEHAANKDMTFEEIMADWNQAWTDAQASLDIETTK